MSNGSNAPTGVARAPAFVIEYGPSGSGKSTTCILSFPRAFFIGAKGGISHVAHSVAGISVASDVGQPNAAYNLEGVIQWVIWAAQAGFEAVIIDDVSVKADRTFREAEGRAPMKNGRKDGYYGYVYTAQKLFELRDLARDLNIHVVMSAHETHAWIDKDSGVRILGRPDFPGNQAPIHFPPVCDAVYRTEIRAGGVNGMPAIGIPPLAPPADPAAPPANTNPFAQGAPAAASMLPTAPQLGPDEDWPGVFRINPTDPDWYTKCRFDTPDFAPMNLGEILRAEGYKISRAPGIEWQEDLVELAAQYVLGGNAEKDVFGWVYSCIQQKLPQVDVDTQFKVKRWTRGDIKARVWIRKSKINRAAALAAGGWMPTQQTQRGGLL